LVILNNNHSVTLLLCSSTDQYFLLIQQYRLFDIQPFPDNEKMLLVNLLLLFQAKKENEKLANAFTDLEITERLMWKVSHQQRKEALVKEVDEIANRI